jgi:hypothetical protein
MKTIIDMSNIPGGDLNIPLKEGYINAKGHKNDDDKFNAIIEIGGGVIITFELIKHIVEDFINQIFCENELLAAAILSELLSVIKRIAEEKLGNETGGDEK